MTTLRPCSRCGERPISCPHNAYCKPCRAAYQRQWRARRTGLELPPDPKLSRVRLRGTPTLAEMVRYGLL